MWKKCIQAIFLFWAVFGFFNHALAIDVPVTVDFARQGSLTLAKISYVIPAPYHAYSNNPGGIGKPTSLSFVLEGTGEVPVIYPAGEEKPDKLNANKKAHIYSGAVDLFVYLPDDCQRQVYAASLDMLLCSDRHCLPFSENFTGQIPGHIEPLSETSWKASAELALEVNDNIGSGIKVEEGSLPPGASGVLEKTPDSPPSEIGKPLADAKEEKHPEFHYPDFTPQYMAEDLEVYSIWSALAFGLLAGLILNAMPCVLPVLTIKVGSLLAMGGATDAKKKRDFRIHNFGFAAGVLSLFTILAIALGAADKIWGQLYQNHALLLLMLLLVFLMGLSMLGVFVLPTFDLRFGRDNRHPVLKAYFTGLFSTFLATPCSGPLLGGVLAWSFTQPLQILMLIFWSVGLGMSLPYLAFGIWPGLAKCLPRPGAWMNIFERILGFLLLATALYLLSILPSAKHLEILAMLLLASVGAWLWGEFCGLNASRLRKWAGGAGGAIILCLCIIFILRPPSPEPEWQQFSGLKFKDELGKQDMIVEFTADWCPNCKFLEATVLTTANLETWQKHYPALLMRADLTDSNPAAEKLLALLGSRSIPLTALFPKGSGSRSPIVLRDLYGETEMRKALRMAFK